VSQTATIEPPPAHAAPRPAPAPRARPQDQPEPPRRWNVVLLDDDDHTYDYVIRLLRTVFFVAEERAYQLAVEIDTRGRAVCLTTHKEHAEFKREQIRGFGADPLIAACRGPMSALIEPALGEGDDDDRDR